MKSSITNPGRHCLAFALVLTISTERAASPLSVLLWMGSPAAVEGSHSSHATIVPWHAQKQGGTPKQAPPPREPTDKKNALPVEVVLLLDKARAVPAQYGSDAILRIVQSSLISDAETKTALIEEAFQLASRAQYPFKRVGLPGSNVDTRDGYLAYAYGLKLDALSLQCRAIRAMVLMNARKAREMLGNIAVPKLPEQNCADALLPDVAELYDTLREVAQRAFTSQQVKEGEQSRFLEMYVESATSPLHVGPIAKMIREVRPSAQQLDFLVHSLSSALEKIAADDRSFSYAMGSPAGREIGELVVACRQQEVIADELLKVYREYLIRHLSGPRCADNVGRKDRPFHTPSYVDWFNTGLRLKATGDIQAISSDDIKPARVAGGAMYYEYWQTRQAKQLLDDARQLRFGSPDRQKREKTGANVRAEPLSAAERASAMWQGMLRQLLNTLDKWKPEHEASSADYLHQKCVIFDTLIDLTPAGPMREKVLGDYLIFLRTIQLQMESGVEWFYYVRRLISSDGSDREVRDLLKATGNPLIELYVDLNKQVP